MTEPKEIVSPDLHPGNTGALDSTRFTAEQSPPGTANYDYITLHHPGRSASTDTYDATDEGDAIVLTINFPTTVTNLSFTLTGIDAEQLQWIDLVSVSPGDFTFAFADVTALQGNGTRLEPFQAIDRSAGLDREDNAGDVRLTWPGAVSEVTVLYRAADEDNLEPDRSMDRSGRLHARLLTTPPSRHTPARSARRRYFCEDEQAGPGNPGSPRKPGRRPIGTLGVTRRTVTRGLAWTAPVVLTAVTAPAYAIEPALPAGGGAADQPGVRRPRHGAVVSAVLGHGVGDVLSGGLGRPDAGRRGRSAPPRFRLASRGTTSSSSIKRDADTRATPSR